MTGCLKPSPHALRWVDIAVVINLKSRGGSAAVADKCQVELPQAPILTSRSLDDLGRFTRGLAAGRSSLVLSAGGDGTAIALLNSMRQLPADGGETMNLAVLPLGTGNGWAHATGAPPWRTAVEQLGRCSRADSPLPLRRFDLLEVGGMLTHFAGTGWDAEIIEDFHRQRSGLGLLPHSMRGGLAGYLQGLFTRTIPRTFIGRPPIVELTNTGDDALGIDAAGHPFPLPGGAHGQVLYRGPASICAAGTSPHWGFKFRAFPFAGLVPGRFNLRIYSGSSLEAAAHWRPLWRGDHPIPKMQSWLLTGARVTYDRPVPFQAGGDRLGFAQEIDYRIASEQVDLLDWARMAA